MVVTQDLPDFTQWTTFAFTGEFSVKALDPPVIPEPHPNGEDGPETCGTFLPIWDEVLPKLDEATWRRNVEAVRIDLARG